MLYFQELFARGYKHGFRYSTLICDGDCKAFEAVKDTYDEAVKKEECKNHLLKRLRKRLDKLFEEHREIVPNKTKKGTHIIKPFDKDEFKVLPSKFGGFYSKAVMENRHLSEAVMSDAVKATFYPNVDHQFATKKARKDFH